MKVINLKTIKTPKENPVVLSGEEMRYYQRALEYAIKHGFKIKIFNIQGKVSGFQG